MILIKDFYYFSYENDIELKEVFDAWNQEDGMNEDLSKEVMDHACSVNLLDLMKLETVFDLEWPKLRSPDCCNELDAIWFDIFSNTNMQQFPERFDVSFPEYLNFVTE